MRKIVIYVPGILTFPGEARNWSGRAVTWTHTRKIPNPKSQIPNEWAEKVEYFCGPLGRAFGQKERARKLYLTLDHYRDWWITLVGHSNGADVIVRMLKDYPAPPIQHLHLVCAACEANFARNHLSRWLIEKRIGKVSVYVAEKDRALRMAHSWLGKILGYGVLGLHGPRNVFPAVKDRVEVVRWPDWGHSDCWEEANFNETMGNFV